MPDQPTPARPQIPDFRDLTRYPAKPSHHRQSYDDDFRSMIEGLARDEREHPLEVAPRPLADPKLSHAEYEKKYAELRRRLPRY